MFVIAYPYAQAYAVMVAQLFGLAFCQDEMTKKGIGIDPLLSPGRFREAAVALSGTCAEVHDYDHPIRH